MTMSRSELHLRLVTPQQAGLVAATDRRDLVEIAVIHGNVDDKAPMIFSVK